MRILDGNGAQADGVNELEDGGIGADSESKGEDSDEGEARTEAKKPQSMAKVAPERGHSIPLAVSDDRRDRMSRGLSTENSDRAAVISERGGGREPLPSEGKTRVFTILQIFEMVRDEQDWSHHSRSGHTRRGSALGAPWRGMAS